MAETLVKRHPGIFRATVREMDRWIALFNLSQGAMKYAKRVIRFKDSISVSWESDVDIITIKYVQYGTETRNG